MTLTLPVGLPRPHELVQTPGKRVEKKTWRVVGAEGNAGLQLDAIRIRKRIDAFGLGNLVCSNSLSL